jgi:hypothetical protein
MSNVDYFLGLALTAKRRWIECATDPVAKRMCLTNLLMLATEQEWATKVGMWAPKLAARQQLTPQDLDQYIDECNVATALVDEASMFIILLREWSRCRPGSDAMTLLLCDRIGAFLDSAICCASSRITRQYDFPFHNYFAELREPTGDDDSRVVIRLIREQGEFIRGNFFHSIVLRGHAYCFNWPSYHDGSGPTEWDEKGLCRIAIREKRFEVLFPNFSKADVSNPYPEVPIT